MRNSVSLRLRTLVLMTLATLAAAGLAQAAVVKAGASDNGGSITLKKGDTLDLTLPTNPSTGYDWTLTQDSTPLLKLTTHSSKKAPGGMLGAPGMATYHFVPTGKGEGNLLMLYSRSWEHSPGDSKKFALHVILK